MADKQIFEDKRSMLEKLNTGLLMMGIQRSIDDAAYYVIDQQTFSHKAINTKHTYSSEVARVLDDIKFTVGLAKEIQSSITIGEKIYEPEDQVAYYNGVLYTLVHSLKDKVIQLLAVMFSEEQLSKAYEDLKSAKVKKFLDKNKELLKKIEIYENLELWLDTAKGPIGKTLNRRNDYHHYQNRQQFNKNMQNLKTARLMQQPSTQTELTDYGKKKMRALEEESLKKIKDDNAVFQTEVFEAISTNIEDVSKKLIDFYKITTDQVELATIGVDYTNFLASLKIENKTSKDKIQPEVQPMIDIFVTNMDQDIKDEIIAVYLVGSCTRGDFVPGSSDINFYVITKNYSTSFDNEMPVTLIVLSEGDLKSSEHKKDRFIIWSDGLLVRGAGCIFEDSEFPKPGIALCLLLNRGVIEKLELLQQEVEKLTNPTDLELRLFSLKVVRLMMDYDYGVAMSNRPLYTTNRKEKIAHTKVVFPNEHRTDILEQIYYGGMVTQPDMKLLIDAFLENARSTYAHLLKIESEMLNKGLAK